MFTPLTTGLFDDRWHTSSRPLYFYQKDMIGLGEAESEWIGVPSMDPKILMIDGGCGIGVFSFGKSMICFMEFPYTWRFPIHGGSPKSSILFSDSWYFYMFVAQEIPKMGYISHYYPLVI